MTILSESDKGIKIKNIVVQKDISDNSIEFIKSQLNNENLYPIIHIPIKKIAIAALSLLGVEKYNGSDEQVKYLESLLVNAK